jgi:3-hydroxyisobutyrate dehydrogenase-like beta-hydroxyacid dehydrogenase
MMSKSASSNPYWLIYRSVRRSKEMSNMSIKTIGVIGLGLMGTPISKLLMKEGFKVIGFDVLEKQVTNLVPLGLIPARSPRDAAKGADLVLLSLPNWKAIEEVVQGKDGLLEGAKKGTIILDLSTSPPVDSRKMAEKVGKIGLEWMDVPISGSSAQAKVGNMVFMAGGKKEIFQAVKPILERIGKKTVYVGANGSGAMLKLVVNHTLMLNQAAAIEGMVLGLKAGLDPEIMLDVLSSGAAGSDLISARGKDMLKGDFAPKGQLMIGVKDLALSLDSAKQLGVVLPMGALYHQFILDAHYKGWDDQDATVVMNVYKEMAGLRDVKGNGDKP